MKVLAEYYKKDELIYYLVQLDNGKVITTKSLR